VQLEKLCRRVKYKEAKNPEITACLSKLRIAGQIFKKEVLK